MCKRIYFLLLLLSLLASGQAFGLTMSINDNVSDNQIVSNGTTSGVASGTFNANPFLTGNSNFNAPYSVSSITLKFNFSDNFDQIAYGANYAYNPSEKIAINLGGTTINAQTQYYDFVSYTQQPYQVWVNSGYYYTYWVSTGWGGGYYSSYWVNTSHYETRYQTVRYDDYGYNGNINIVQEILPSSSLWDDLRNTGLLNYTITSTDGDIVFTNAQMIVTMNENPQSAPVPEPSSCILFGAGIAGLAIFAKRRREHKI